MEDQARYIAAIWRFNNATDPSTSRIANSSRSGALVRDHHFPRLQPLPKPEVCCVQTERGRTDPWANGHVKPEWFKQVFSELADLNRPISNDVIHN